jgi:hypothetical protein
MRTRLGISSRHLRFVDVVVSAGVRPTDDHDYKVRAGKEAKIVYWRLQAISVFQKPTGEIDR